MNSGYRQCIACGEHKALIHFTCSRNKYYLKKCKDCVNQLRRDEWLAKRLSKPIVKSHKIALALLDGPKTRTELLAILGGRKDNLNKVIRDMKSKNQILKANDWNRPVRLHPSILTEEDFLINWQEHKSKECRKHHPRYRSDTNHLLNKFFQKAF